MRLVVIAASLLAFACKSPSGPASPPTAKELFERHLEASGGRDRLMSIKTAVMTGTFELVSEGIKGPSKRHVVAPNHYRSAITIPNVGDFEEGFDGERMWANDPVLGPRLQPEAARPEMLIDADIQFDATYDRYVASMRVIGPEDFDGQPTFRVEVITKDAGKQIHYFHRESGLRVGLEYDSVRGAEPEHVRAVFRDYRDVDGWMFPGVVDTGTFVVRTKQVDLNVEVPSLKIPDDVLRAISPKRIEGIVLASGEPVAGADVLLVARTQTVEGRFVVDSREEEHRTTTGDDGRFRFEGVDGESYRVSANHDLKLGSLSGRIPKDGDLSDLTIELSPGVRFKGRIVDASGAPIPDARLHAGSGCVFYGGAKSGADGTFDWILGLGHFEISAHKNGYLAASETVVAKKAKLIEKTWTLERAAVASGVVVDEGGHPLADVELALVGGERRNSTVTSGPDGRFTFDGAAPGKWQLEILNRPRQKGQTVKVPFEGVEVLVRGRAQIVGVVLDEKGTPRADAEVVLGLDGVGGFSWQTKTNASGEFAFTPVTAGAAYVEAYLPSLRHTRKVIDVPPEGELEVKIAFEVGLSIQGRVLDESDRPLFGVEVTVVGAITGPEAREHVIRNAVTDVKGRFTAENLSPGAYDITARRRAIDEAIMLATGGARASAGDTDIEIRLPATTLVKGRVVDPAGRPVVGAEVGENSSRTDGSGRFAFALPAKRGSTISVSASGFAPKVVDVGDLEGKATRDLGDVRVDPGATVTLRVLDAKTKGPIEGAGVYVAGRFPKPGERPTYTDKAGNIEVENIGADPVLVTVSADRYVPTKIDVSAGAPRVDVVLSKGGVIRGRVTAKDGAPVANVAPSCSGVEFGYARTDADGRFELAAVPPGNHTLVIEPRSFDRASKPRFFDHPTVTVTDGETATVEMKERSTGATVRIAVVDHNGVTTPANAQLLPGRHELPRTSDDLVALRKIAYSSGTTPFGNKLTEIPFVPNGSYTLLVSFMSMGAGQIVHVQELVVSNAGAMDIEVQLPPKPHTIPLF